VRAGKGDVASFGAVALCLPVAELTELACSVGPEKWGFDGEESPLVGDALEFVRAAISEWDAGAADEVGDGAGDEDFVGLCERLAPLGDVEGDAPDVVTA
jgi:hypothetical protein